MIFVYSSDTALVELCINLFGKKDKIKHLVGKKGLDALKTTQKDILIIDLESLKEKDLPAFNCPTMILAAIPVNDQAMRLLRHGARAYGNRHMHEENLQQAVLALKAGQIWLPPAIINRMISGLPVNKIQKGEEHLLKTLTAREIEVAKWLVKGLSNREISEKLFVSIRTVKAHLTSIFKKTNCRNRLELATRMK